jgi:YidC/Oxa1 family membrane protein insertase
MEEQGKRLLLAIVLALGILLLWQFLFPGEKPKPKPKTDDVLEPERNLESPVGMPIEGAAPVAGAAAGDEQIVEKDYPNVEIEFSNRGGKLVSWKLTDEKYARDWTKGEMIASRELGAFAVNFYKSPIVIPVDAIWTPIDGLEENQVGYKFTSADLTVTKIFTIHAADYLLELATTVELLAQPGATAPREAVQQLALQLVSHQDPKAPKGGGMGQTTRETRAACHLNGDVSQIPAPQLHERGGNERGGNVRWVGFNHPYLFFAVAPKNAGRENLACNAYPVLSIPGGMEVDLVYQAAKLKSDAPPMTKEVVAYIGPKHLDKLEGASDIAAFSTAFDDSVDMGWFSFIARPLLWLMTWFYSLVGNWGISIILLTFVVKLATLYWTTKSMRSMKGMAALKPQMEELQKKYADDKAKLQQEMMGLYKANGINPLSGCLPLLLQMPIWLALYRMLSSVGELYLAPFIPGWIDDLTATDPYYILPVAVTGMMFLSSKLSPTTVDNLQQKIIIYGMPLIFGVMSFFFPSGLSIYILTNSTLSLLHTLYMKKFDKGGKKPVVAAVAAKDKDKDGVKPREAAAKRKDAKPEPKPVIDVESEEASEPESDDDDDGDDEVEAKPAAPAKNVQAQPQKKNPPRRKRKRGRH